MAEAEYKVWVALGGDLRADRVCALLQSVASDGSLNAAARSLGISYRYAWGLLKKAEEQIGAPLLRSRTGGSGGGGADLTAAALGLLDRYQRFRAAVSDQAEPLLTAPEPTARPVVLASTIGPVETGLLPALEAAWQSQTGLLVRHIAAGTSQALSLAQSGLADLVLAHAPDAEQAFMDQGFGSLRRPLMESDFLLVGPRRDPAGVRRSASAAQALQQIARAGAPFLSRGDGSGTHLREQALWQAAGLTPEPPWYRISPRGAQGTGPTLSHAHELDAYVLADRATYVTVISQIPGLESVWAGPDPDLANRFSLTLVHPKRFPNLRTAEARAFLEWATGPGGQAVVARFGVSEYGQALFRPVRQGGSVQAKEREA